jgi:putative sigma-54 modulation protein
MKMELSQDQFMVYRSEKDYHIKIIFRKTDGNYGIIYPEG